VKHLHGSAGALVTASLQASFAMLEAVHLYPTWDGELIRQVEVMEWTDDDRPARAWAQLHVAQGPFAKTLELVVAVHAHAPDLVRLTRVPNEPSDPERLDLTWRLFAGSGTRIELEFEAAVAALPRLAPVGGAGELIARKLLGAAARELGRKEDP
jgi:hypothetical protein